MKDTLLFIAILVVFFALMLRKRKAESQPQDDEIDTTQLLKYRYDKVTFQLNVKVLDFTMDWPDQDDEARRYALKTLQWHVSSWKEEVEKEALNHIMKNVSFNEQYSSYSARISTCVEMDLIVSFLEEAYEIYCTVDPIDLIHKDDMGSLYKRYFNLVKAFNPIQPAVQPNERRLY